MRLGLVTGCLCCWIVLVCSGAPAETTVSINLSADFPLGIATVVRGELRGELMPNMTWELSHPKLGDQKLLGQSDESGKRLWIALTATEELIGKPLDLKGVAAEIDFGDEAVMSTTRRAGGYALKESDRLILFYQKDALTRHGHTRAGFVHRLRGLDDETLTEIFPADHRHHQAVFWAWHQLWVGDRKIGDPWVTKDHLVAVQTSSARNRGPLFTDLFVTAHWVSPLLTNDDGSPKPIVAEETTICLFRASQNAQYIDFIIRLTPLMPDVKIGGSENVKGYSGFTVRVKPPNGMMIEDASGVRNADAVQTASAWADVYGRFGKGKTSGVGILSHPSLAQFPPRWLLRHYGMQNVAYPGREPVALSAEEPLVIRHRLILHRGTTEQARIAEHQQVYELTP
ncbi:MAG: hypothetical protein CMJ64_26590 [Planctomycetaceae bacterium]|nr:hypothetical protein [Planctomycetaceae bacterium]